MNKQYVSAQLPATQRLEQLLMSGDPNAVKQVGGSFQQVYGVLPTETQAPQFIRYSIDISDAQAQDAMKRAIEWTPSRNARWKSANSYRTRFAPRHQEPLLWSRPLRQLGWSGKRLFELAMAQLMRVRRLQCR